MFAGLINQAKSAASHLVLKYVARASVAVPFVIAAGFALAAITVMLVERFGHVMAYWLVAGGLALIGVIASIVVSVKEHEEEVVEQQAAKTDTEELVSDATAQALAQTPIALLGALMTMPGGAAGRVERGALVGTKLAVGSVSRDDRRAVLADRRRPGRRRRRGWTQAERLRRPHAQRVEALKVSMPRGAWGARSDVARCLAPLQYQIDLDGTPKQHYAA